MIQEVERERERFVAGWAGRVGRPPATLYDPVTDTVTCRWAGCDGRTFGPWCDPDDPCDEGLTFAIEHWHRHKREQQQIRNARKVAKRAEAGVETIPQLRVRIDHSSQTHVVVCDGACQGLTFGPWWLAPEAEAFRNSHHNRHLQTTDARRSKR